MLPAHLKRYVVEQDYSRYTPVDQEVWRYIMRQLKSFLSEYAHPCYVDGLERTGIEIDRIPDIKVMSQKLEKFGWRAIPVSGFIPPAAFMELQSLGFLPIASDMRSLDHLLYTPAPDIVHEAAGHAPILIDPDFAAYLKTYAQVASKAIIGSDDMAQYEAIRVLSDLKEDPVSTPEQIQAAEKKLEVVTESISNISEAALLSRMNWWTVEYGLIGTLEAPRIFGAGLLSSIGEAKACLDAKVKKIPLSIDCINYSYDITEPQPQLFVTPDFNRLREVLEELAERMSFRRGGTLGLDRAKLAQTVNTVELNSGLEVSGRLADYQTSADQPTGQPTYLQFQGPVQLSLAGSELKGHGTQIHAQGFGSPVGFLEGTTVCISAMSDSDLQTRGIEKGKSTELKFANGTHVKGEVIAFTRSAGGHVLLISFRDCTVTLNGKTLFEPAWGTFDMAVGSKVTSVLGGPADRKAYGEIDDFAAKTVPRAPAPPLQAQVRRQIYQDIRDIRGAIESGSLEPSQETSDRLETLLNKTQTDYPNDWLLQLDIFELSHLLPSVKWRSKAESGLKNLAQKNPAMRSQIENGLRLIP